MSEQLPLLNRPDYIQPNLRTTEDDIIQTYDISRNMPRTVCSKDRFIQMYEEMLVHFTQIERLEYLQYQKKEKKPQIFFEEADRYAQQHYPELCKGKGDSDRINMIKRLCSAMFEYDFITPLLDDSHISDIKICSPFDIRVRVDGRAKLSNVTFFDDRDLYRFIEGLSVRNNIDILSSPIITFTDKRHPDYILRFVVSSPMITADGCPAIHIRKVSRHKPGPEELHRRKMITPKVFEFLRQETKTARTITLAGPPGSGKSTLLNELIEFIPKWRETLVIQENDELYTEQSGFIFEHVTHGFRGEPSIGLVELGEQALVQGCNEFIIGEVKGAEMRSAATLFQTGGYGMWTVHADSARDVLPRCAALIKEGSSYSLDEANNRLKDCEIIVYMSDYKVREIIRCTGYDKSTGEFTYDEIYKRELDPEALALDAS